VKAYRQTRRRGDAVKKEGLDEGGKAGSGFAQLLVVLGDSLCGGREKEGERRFSTGVLGKKEGI